MKRTEDESLALYEQIKSYFSVEENTSLVVEISSLPMFEWKVYITHSHDQMYKDRGQAMDNLDGFAAFYCFESEKSFHYSDRVIMKGEDLKTGEILYFDTHEAMLHEFNLAKGEFKQLLKLLKVS